MLNYFWTAIAAAKAISYVDDCSTVEATYHQGQTRYMNYDKSELKIHDLTSIGESELIFITVEFLDSRKSYVSLV